MIDLNAVEYTVYQVIIFTQPQNEEERATEEAVLDSSTGGEVLEASGNSSESIVEYELPSYDALSAPKDSIMFYE